MHMLDAKQLGWLRSVWDNFETTLGKLGWDHPFQRTTELMSGRMMCNLLYYIYECVTPTSCNIVPLLSKRSLNNQTCDFEWEVQWEQFGTPLRQLWESSVEILRCWEQLNLWMGCAMRALIRGADSETPASLNRSFLFMTISSPHSTLLFTFTIQGGTEQMCNISLSMSQQYPTTAFLSS